MMLTVARRHWKQFAWVWLCPLLILASIDFAYYAQVNYKVVYSIDLVILFVCFRIASKPVREQEVPLGQGVFWVVVVPVLIWATSIFGLFGLAFLARVTGVPTK